MADDVATSNAEDRVDPATLDVETDTTDVESVSPTDPAQEAAVLKERYKAARQGGEEASRRLKEKEAELERLRQERDQFRLHAQSSQFQQPYQQQPQQFQQQRPQPQFDARGYTPEMRAALANLDNEVDPEGKRAEIQEEAAINRERMGQATMIQALSAVGQYTQKQQIENGLISMHQDVLADPQQQRLILQEAYRIQSDPYEAAALKDAQAVAQLQTETGPVNVNPYALNQAAKAYKIRNEAIQRASAGRGTIGGPQASGPQPGQRAPMEWNPSVHLSQAERAAFADLDEEEKALGVGLKQYWNSLPRGLRDARLRAGKPISREAWESGMYDEV